MSRDKQYLLDIIDSARLAASYAANRNYSEFLNDILLQDGIIRRLEIVGEASRRLSPQTRSAMPHIPWKEFIGMRNIMIHQYEGVDLLVVWDTVQKDIPFLITQIEQYLT